MDLKTAVIIATKGRSQEVSDLIRTLSLQTALPDLIVVSACDPNDIEPDIVDEKTVYVLFGSPGLAAQRNRALSLIQGKYDVVIFFDDDFIPSRFWIERIHHILATQPEVGCVTGRILVDGASSGGFEWAYGQSLVNSNDQKISRMNDHGAQDLASPYGCNMAFRAKTIENLWFDERLVLYGWLEDRDFGFRAATRAKAISTEAAWGVHLGSNRGRVSGLKFGYSQVVNPWYLMRKGVLKPFDLAQTILFGLAANFLGSIFGSSHIDRFGRLKGNMIAIQDIILHRWAPERITEL
jgi:GT2 family glycosyltransferase